MKINRFACAVAALCVGVSFAAYTQCNCAAILQSTSSTSLAGASAGALGSVSSASSAGNSAGSLGSYSSPSSTCNCN